MFGYIRPNHLELKLKDIRRYSGYYCARTTAFPAALF